MFKIILTSLTVVAHSAAATSVGEIAGNLGYGASPPRSRVSSIDWITLECQMLNTDSPRGTLSREFSISVPVGLREADFEIESAAGYRFSLGRDGKILQVEDGFGRRAVYRCR